MPRPRQRFAVAESLLLQVLPLLLETMLEQLLLQCYLHLITIIAMLNISKIMKMTMSGWSYSIMTNFEIIPS